MGDKDSAKVNSETNAAKTDKRKQSLYFPESMLQEIKEEAARLESLLVVDCSTGLEDRASGAQEAPERE